jgi:hypothetical protein
MLGRIERQHVGSVRGNTRPARAVHGWARLLAAASALWQREGDRSPSRERSNFGVHVGLSSA